MVPLYLKYIPRDVYGYWLATGNIIAWIALIDPGYSQVIQQKVAFHYGSGEKKLLGQYAYLGIILNLFIICFILLVGLIIYFFFNNIFPNIDNSINLSLQKAFGYTLIGTVLMLSYYIIGTINYGLQSSLGIGIITTIGNFGGLAANIYFLINGYGVISFGIASIIRGALYLFLSLLYMKWRFSLENISLSYNKSLLKDFLGLIGFNFLGKLGNTLSQQLNSFVIAKSISPIEVTTLKFSQSVPDLSKLFFIRPASALMPSITHLAGEGANDRIQIVLLRFLNYLIWASGLALMGFILFNKAFITLWVGASFYGGDLLNLLIVFLLFLTLFTYSFSNIVFALGNIKKNSLVQFSQALIYIPLLLLGSKFFGLEGVVIAAIIAELSIAGWYYPLTFFKKIRVGSQVIKKVIIELIKVVCVATILILFYKPEINSWFKLIVNISVAVIIYFTSLIVISKNFRNEVLTIILKIKCKLIKR